jgi:hypothetical protein
MRHAGFTFLTLVLCGTVPSAALGNAARDYSVSFLQPGADGYNHGPSVVAALGASLVVGSPAEARGAVDVYDMRTGERRLHLTPIVPRTWYGFGCAVAASSRGFLVGDCDANEAYLFHRHTGDLVRTFRAPSDGRAGSFGGAVADLGASIAVGDPGALVETANGLAAQGRLHLFDERDGQMLLTLVDPVVKQQSRFGASVVRVAGGFAVGQPAGYFDPGSVFVYDRRGALVQTLAAPMPVADDNFGLALAAEGSRLFVGAPGGGTINSALASRVYVYRRRGGLFVLESALEAPAALAWSFGRALTAKGSRVVVGSRTGAALFRFGHTTPLAVLEGPTLDEDLYNHFFLEPWYGLGASVAIVGKTIVATTDGGDESAGAIVVGFAPDASPPPACGEAYQCP